MAKKILVVVTNVEKYPSLQRATGLWLGEAVHFVRKVAAAGFAVDYVSPRGGYTPIDPHSLALADDTDWAWYHQREFVNRLGATLPAKDIDANEYVAIYFTGGHGVVWDFPDNAALQAIARRIYEHGGWVASVCHGAAGLLNIRLSDGQYLIKGKRLTGFSNEEEQLAKLAEHVPFLTETELSSRGALYEKADQPWAPHAVADARLVTGQNPASGGLVADLLIEGMRPTA